MIWPWLLHPGSRWIPNVLISSETGSEWQTILGHPQMIECMGISVLSLAHGSGLWGSNVYVHIVKKSSGIFSLSLTRVCALCLDFFFFFPGGSVGQIIYREHIVFQGWNVSCSLACVWPSLHSCGWGVMGKKDRNLTVPVNTLMVDGQTLNVAWYARWV